MRKLFAAAFTVVIFATSHAASAQSDPYADAYRQQLRERWDRAYADEQKQVAMFYFARRCGVLNNQQLGTLNGHLISRLVATWQSLHPGISHIPPPNLDDLTSYGKVEATNLMLNAGGCDYFRQNPEIVAELREEGF
jgi:hypothetical protein